MVFPIVGVGLAVDSFGFFLLAALDDERPNYWLPVLSLGLWIGAIFGLGWGFGTGFLLQVGLFVAATTWGMVRASNGAPSRLPAAEAETTSLDEPTPPPSAPHDLADPIFEHVANAIERLADTPEEIYVISFFVHDEEDDPRRPTLTVGYNTAERWRESVPAASSESEAKWNYAFWLQNEIAAFGRGGTPSQGIVTVWLKEQGLYFSNEQVDADFDSTHELGVRMADRFVTACCAAARRLHNEGVVSRATSPKVPILVHDLEYTDAIADQNDRCNPNGVADKFIRWIRTDECR